MRNGRLPPALMGLANLPFGLWGGLTLVTVPQLLAARHVPEPVIASITAAAMIPTFSGFLIAPILDVGLGRRAYARLFGLLTAAFAWLVLAQADRTATLAVLMIAGWVAANLFYNALGGWLGDVVDKGQEGRLGASFTIGNVVGFGVGAMIFITVLRAAPPAWGPPTAALVVAAPLVLTLWIPAVPPGGRTAQESFATLFRDLGQLLRQTVVLRTLLLFALPAASFALTNILGGLGRDFAASEAFVGRVAGMGVVVGGLVGSLLVPWLVGRIAPRLLYLAIGGLGATFTLALIGLPPAPWVFVLAMVGQNIFQAAAFAVESTIVFRTIGEANPLAATQFGLLQAMTCLPIVYMLAIDGWAYGAGKLPGMLLTDAGLSLLACALLLPLVLAWRRRERVLAVAA